MSTQAETIEQPKNKAPEAGKKSGVVVVDYNGMVAAVKGQPSVPHTSTPLILWWPENGKPILKLNPGVNLIDAKLWDFYNKVDDGHGGKGAPQLMEKIKRGQVKVITALPNDEYLLLNLIKRTIDHAGLEWLLKQAQAETEVREHIITEIENRAAVARPAKIDSIGFQGIVPRIPGKRNAEYVEVEQTLAMS